MNKQLKTIISVAIAVKNQKSNHDPEPQRLARPILESGRRAPVLAVLLWICCCLACAPGFGQVVTWQENWELPAAQDDWVADLGYWEIGVPTYGPPDRGDGWRAHQGTNVAATVLDGNYTDDRQSRLVSSPVTIPAAGQNPRLRFWHWWSFSCDDYGQVQISTNNGASWVNLSGQYWADSSGRWSRAWVDLTAYAGKTVRFGLYFYSHNSAGCSGSLVDVAAGWYVDEMEIESGSPVHPALTLPEGFETGWAGWTADYIGGTATDFAIWEIGVPTSGPGAARSGTNCAATVLTGNYPEDRSSRLISQPLTVPAAGFNPRLRFWHWWSFSCDDYGQVQISTNNGASWVNLSGQYWADSSGRWSRAWVDLTAYAGKTVRLGLYFYSHNNAGCSGSLIDVATGWYVDDFVLETGPEAGFDPAEGFETGWAGWTADYIGGTATDFAIWEIGTPTSGPGSARTGTNCLATVLNGNYPEDRESRIVSPPFVVPPAECSPRLRFWHWWSFSCDDYGQVQISTNNGASWQALATYSASSPWTRPQLNLTPYEGSTARLAFYFYSHNSAGCSGSNPDVSSGWYVDDIRLLHDPALWLTGSPVVRTQSSGCVNLAVALDAATTGASFMIETAAGNLSNPALQLQGCWTGSITPQSPTLWLVNLQSTCSVGTAGVETIGTLCFTAVSTRSAFVPLTVSELVFTNLGSAHGYSARAVHIANEPLLEPWLTANQTRMATLFGKANTNYVIHYSTNAAAASPWAAGWSNTVPESLYIQVPVSAPASNAPVLFLRAQEL